MAQIADLSAWIAKEGGVLYPLPVLEIKPPRSLEPLKGFVRRLCRSEADYVVFMSANGVGQLVASSKGLGLYDLLMAGLKRARVVALGPRTGEELARSGIRVDIMPESFSSDGIVESLEPSGISGRRIFIPRVRGASSYLADRLRRLGGKVSEFYVYEITVPDDRSPVSGFIRDLRDGKIDGVIFTSSFSVKNLYEISLVDLPGGGQLKDLLNEGVTKVAIGPSTLRTLEGLGVDVDVMPQEHTVRGAVRALLEFWGSAGARQKR